MNDSGGWTASFDVFPPRHPSAPPPGGPRDMLRAAVWHALRGLKPRAYGGPSRRDVVDEILAAAAAIGVSRSNGRKYESARKQLTQEDT